MEELQQLMRIVLVWLAKVMMEEQDGGVSSRLWRDM